MEPGTVCHLRAPIEHGSRRASYGQNLNWFGLDPNAQFNVSKQEQDKLRKQQQDELRAEIAALKAGGSSAPIVDKKPYLDIRAEDRHNRIEAGIPVLPPHSTPFQAELV
jgi:hypothetical protein